MGSEPKPIVSAFNAKEGYGITELAKQFVHYAMTDLPPKIEFSDDELPEDSRHLGAHRIWNRWHRQEWTFLGMKSATGENRRNCGAAAGFRISG
jgi:hypothetical protein